MEIIIQNDSLSHRECSVLGLNEVFAEDCERQALLFDGFISASAFEARRR